MTLPSHQQALADLRNALEEIEKGITPQTNAYQYDTAKQAAPPYWKNLVQRLIPDQDPAVGTGLVKCNATVLCIYNAGMLTSPQAEKKAQEVLFDAVVAFNERPLLQSTTYVDGVDAVDPEGAIIEEAQVAIAGEAPQQLLTAEIRLRVPLLFQLDTIN